MHWTSVTEWWSACNNNGSSGWNTNIKNDGIGIVPTEFYIDGTEYVKIGGILVSARLV